jgi:hypothetical protein
MQTGDMVTPGKGVANQHGVAVCGIELAIGFENQLETGQHGAAPERQRRLEMYSLRRDDSDGIL